MSGVLWGWVPWRCRNICSILKLARQAGCPSLAWCCSMSLHYFSLFESLAVSGVGWAPRPFLSVMRYDHKEAVGVGWGLLNTSSIFSILVSGYGQYHLGGWGSRGCTKAVTQGIIQDPEVFLDCSSGYRRVFSKDFLTPYIFVAVPIAKPYRAELVCNTCMN